MITIELPDGEQVDIDTDDEARAVEAARRYWRSKPKRQEEQQPEQSALMSGLEYAGNLGMEVLSGAGRGLVGGAEYILGLDPESQRRDAMWREKLTGIKSTVKVPSLASDVLPQKGEFAGEGLATDIAAMAGEYAAPAGALGRVVGKAPAIAEAVTGALSGVGAAVGGEVGESIGGETGRTVGEIAGGMIAPMSMDNYIRTKALPELKGQIKDKAAIKALGDAAPTSENLKNVGRGIYKEIDDLGGFYSADQLSKLSKTLEDDMTDFGISKGGNPRAFAIMSEIMEETTKNQTLKGLDNLRKRAGNLSRSADGAEKEAGRRMASIVDDFLDSNTPKSFKTGKEVKGVSDKYKDARKVWRQAKKAELIEDALKNASRAASGVQSGTKNEFKALLKNKRTRNIWSKKEESAMEAIIQGDFAENAARHLGRFGFPLDQARNFLGSQLGMVSGVGGGALTLGGPGAVAGFVVVPTIGTVSRFLSEKMTRDKSKMLKALITAGDNGVDITKAYLKNTNKSEQSVEDLAQLLAKESINKGKIKSFADNLGPDKKKLVRDALFFSSMPQLIQQRESEEQQ